MIIPKNLSHIIVNISISYLDTPFDLERFNCVHFVRKVYKTVGVTLPLLCGHDFPPKEFHLTEQEFNLMPVGHSVFFRRKLSPSNRVWTHVAIIISDSQLIHCTRHCGMGVVCTEKKEFLEIYSLVVQ